MTETNAARPAHPDELPAEHVRRIDRLARRRTTPCGSGHMVWRIWGEGPPLVLLHGGHGSWTHWLRNIPALAEHFTTIVPDLPGYGDSDLPPQTDPVEAEALAAIIAAGLDLVLPPPSTYHLAGFSFGGIIGGHVAVLQGKRVETLSLVGAGGLNLSRGEVGKLMKWRHDMPPDEFRAAHRHNLAVIMFGDSGKIDELAVWLQGDNTSRGRVRAQHIARSGTLREALPQVKARLIGIWGERDVYVGPYLDERAELLRKIQPDAQFHVIGGAGHWVPFEAAKEFNAVLLKALGGAKTSS